MDVQSQQIQSVRPNKAEPGLSTEAVIPEYPELQQNFSFLLG